MKELALAAALYAGFFPWLGMGFVDMALALIAPLAAVLHVIAAGVGLALKQKRAGFLLLAAAVGWAGVGFVGRRVTPYATARLVDQAEHVVAEREECEATRPDYYPAGALIHCLTRNGRDSLWTSFWVTKRPFGVGEWTVESNNRF